VQKTAEIGGEMTVVLALLLALAIPVGFAPIFNGRDLSGWHIGQTNHHGKTKSWRVENGVIVGSQNPVGEGGILLTNQKYQDFEVYLEINPDFGCDGGLFLRSSEAGEAYQVMIDYLDGGSVGGIYGEGLTGVTGTASESWTQHWRKGEWNSLRVRIEGGVPHITVWLNGAKITDWKDTANHAANEATEGMIALQVHGGKRWAPNGQHRFRNIAVRRLDR